MKLLALIPCLLLIGCSTVETFDSKGNRTSRTRSPSPETWTVIGNAVANFGASAVSQWTQQMADQQRWERGEK